MSLDTPLGPTSVDRGKSRSEGFSGIPIIQFLSSEDVRRKIDSWRDHYNEAFSIAVGKLMGPFHPSRAGSGEFYLSISIIDRA